MYYIDSYRVLASSIQSITKTDKATYITLHDGAIINTANFGRAAFWSRSEAELARFLWEQNGGNRYWKSVEKYLDWLKQPVKEEV